MKLDRWTTLLLAVYIGGANLLGACALQERHPEEYVETIRRYLHLPEPVLVTTWAITPGAFDIGKASTIRAAIHYDKKSGAWMIALNETWWDRASYSQRMMTLSHELCHTIYDHDILIPDLWYDISEEEWGFRQKRARECAWDVVGRMAR